MNYKLLMGVFLLIAVLFTGTAVADSTEIPPLPAQYYGTILIDGKPAPAGTTIIAQIGNETVGTITTTEPGVFGSSGTFGAKLLVAPASSEAEGKEVIFKTGKSLAQETINFSAGDARKISLNFLSENSLLISLRMPDTILAGRPANASVQITSTIPLDGCVLNLTDESGVPYWEDTLSDDSFSWSSTGIPVTLPEGSHTLTLSVENREKTATSSVSVNAIAYILEITEDNKAAWNTLYGPDGYNLTAYKGSSAAFGTYYTSNAENVINYTIDFGENITKIFESGTENPISGSILATNSSNNLLSWHSLNVPKEAKLGTYPYTINLSSGTTRASVSGNFILMDAMVDIKVLESGSFSDTSSGGSLKQPLAVYNREDSNKATRSIEIAASAGVEGRALQGLDYLLDYPHGCPEQVSSPTLASLYILENYRTQGKLNDEFNETVRTITEYAVNNFASPGGFSYQRSNGGWAWFPNDEPWLYYTAYPMYTMALVKQDIQDNPEFWTNLNEMHLDGIDLNKSTTWLQNHKTEFLGNSEYTYLTVQALDAAYPFLTDDAKQVANGLFADAADSLTSSYGWNIAPDLVSLALINKYLDEPSVSSKITEYANQFNTTYTRGSPSGNDYGQTALAVYGLILTENPDYSDAISNGVAELVDSYGTGGRWDNTQATGKAIRTLNAAPGGTAPDGNWQISVTIGGVTKSLSLSKANPSGKVYLTEEELDTLYGDVEADLSYPITVSKPTGVKTTIAVTSKEQVPKSTSLGYGTTEDPIPEKHIDPIASEEDMTLVIPDQGPFTPGEHVVELIGWSRDEQKTLILTIYTGEEKNVRFNATKYGENNDGAAYTGDDHIGHMYNASTQILSLYPEFDNLVSLAANTETSFFVPLEFTSVGSATIDARLAPMAGDEWMALANKDVRITGNGVLNLNTYTEAGAEYISVIPDDIIITDDNDTSVDSKKLSELPEGTYDITVICDGVSAEIPDLDIQAGSIQTYSIYFVQPEPVILTGDTKYTSAQSSSEPEITLIANTVEDRTWSAIVPANVTYQLSPSSLAELRAPEISHADKTITLTEKVNVIKYVGETASSVAASVAQDGTVTVSGDISDASLLQVSFIGRPLGDVTGGGSVNIIDASAIAQYTVHLKSFDDVSLFYADCIGTGVNIIDASAIAQYTVHLVDEHYRPIS